jgi:hypothetical protein
MPVFVNTVLKFPEKYNRETHSIIITSCNRILVEKWALHFQTNKCPSTYRTAYSLLNQRSPLSNPESRLRHILIWSFYHCLGFISGIVLQTSQHKYCVYFTDSPQMRNAPPIAYFRGSSYGYSVNNTSTGGQ